MASLDGLVGVLVMWASLVGGRRGALLDIVSSAENSALVRVAAEVGLIA